MQYFNNLLKTPKTQIGGFLTLILITAFLNNPSQKSLIVFLLSLLSTVISDLLFMKLRGIRVFFPSAAVVSACIIGLLTSPNHPWYVPIAIGIIAMLSKNFVRLSNRHIFNPAGFGLIIGSIIFNQNISWWGVSWQQFRIHNLEFIIYFLILLSPAFVSMVKMKRYRITLSFFLVYILLSKTLNSVLDPTTLFFTTVMLPEPMTSPNNHKRQILFGSLVALLCFLPTNVNFVDPFIIALLIGNLVFFKFR